MYSTTMEDVRQDVGGALDKRQRSASTGSVKWHDDNVIFWST